MAFDLRDSSGQAWRFSMTDAGLLTSDRVNSNGVQPVVIAEFFDSVVAYALGVTTIGLITTTAATPGSYPPRVQMVSSGGVVWYLVVSHAGILQAMGGPNVAVPVVGQVLGNGSSYPTPVQPGGIGYPVTSPAETQGEHVGRFSFGCGHTANTIEIRKAQNGAGQSAFLCCPLDGYIQRIITPYSDIYDNTVNQILVV